MKYYAEVKSYDEQYDNTTKKYDTYLEAHTAGEKLAKKMPLHKSINVVTE